jgi:hypothetical protein
VRFFDSVSLRIFNTAKPQKEVTWDERLVEMLKRFATTFVIHLRYSSAFAARFASIRRLLSLAQLSSIFDPASKSTSPKENKRVVERLRKGVLGEARCR